MIKLEEWNKLKKIDMNQEILNYFQVFGMGSCANGKPMLESVVKNGERRYIKIEEDYAK